LQQQAEAANSQKIVKLAKVTRRVFRRVTTVGELCAFSRSVGCTAYTRRRGAAGRPDEAAAKRTGLADRGNPTKTAVGPKRLSLSNQGMRTETITTKPKFLVQNANAVVLSPKVLSEVLLMLTLFNNIVNSQLHIRLWFIRARNQHLPMVTVLKGHQAQCSTTSREADF